MARADQVPHGNYLGKRCKLLASYPHATRWSGERDEKGEPIMLPQPYWHGQIVKCVMVSRFGDCGITDKLDAATGYDLRVQPEELEIL